MKNKSKGEWQYDKFVAENQGRCKWGLVQNLRLLKTYICWCTNRPAWLFVLEFLGVISIFSHNRESMYMLECVKEKSCVILGNKIECTLYVLKTAGLTIQVHSSSCGCMVFPVSFMEDTTFAQSILLTSL